MKKKLVSLILAATFVIGSVFTQPMEAQAATWSTYGSVEKKNGVYHLTDDVAQTGTVAYNKKINTKAGATVTFKYYAKKGENSTTEADAITAMFTSEKVTGTYGSGETLGMKPGEDTYAVEFDSYKNTTDPNYHHIGIIQGNAYNHLNSVKSSKVADGKWHTAKILVASDRLTVYVDSKKVISSEVALPKYVYLSINGITGSCYCDHKVKSISVEQNKERLATPEITVTSKKKNTAVITWKKVKNADKYIVYRSTSKRGDLTKVKETSSLKFTDTKVKGGKTYYYTVLAYDQNDDYLDSTFSYVESIKVKK